MRFVFNNYYHDRKLADYGLFHIASQVIQHVEYIAIMPPRYLYKAMEKEFAEAFITSGSLRLRTSSYFHGIENNAIGDDAEGVGMGIINGTMTATKTANPNYILCTSMSNDIDMLLGLDAKYNTVVEIYNVIKFGDRLALALNTHNPGRFFVQAGIVRYNKGNLINSYFWNDNQFQKSKEYSYQYEYRYVISDHHFKIDEFIDVSIGDCTDVARIVAAI